MRTKFLLVSCAIALGACAGDKAPIAAANGADDAAMAPALASITADGLMAHTKALGDDSLEGRGPATPGEDKAVAYLMNQFKQLGLTSGNPDGSFVQDVTLLGFTAHPDASFTVGSRVIPLSFPTDFVAVSRHDKPIIDVNAEMVFVGYGVEAPEYGWDDYKGLDVKGKVLVMLVNDPAVPDPADSTKLDAAMFKGNAMTYYGRWTYKYEIATAKGAAGAILIHETGPAGYPYEVVSGSWGRENFDIAQPEATNTRVMVESWITQPRAEELLKATGKDFAQLKAAAKRKDFKPVPLGASVKFHVRNDTRTVKSRNVVATLKGSDAARKNEYIIYTAHWDHLGRDTTIKGDQIFNGALDNASGCATLLELAKAYTKLASRPARSVMFIALTGEEKGLIGAKYFAEHPLVPLDHVLANINMDGFNQWGKTSDVVVVGFGNSTLEDVLADVLKPAGRTLAPEPEPEKGYYFRSDHFEFAKQGVPALYLEAGTRFIGKDSTYGRTKRDEYTTKDYHKPSDEVKPDWDLSGAVDDARALFQVGYRVTSASEWPTWKPGTEFKARRDSVMAAKK
ncbi:MAG: M20/M25/M40 family metallo-hydrolase [Gemmatimonadaceae bacterium]|nr:M20/M25/M40 family metallo-hydrolase [Gemmatimonadaceae bacterium]